MKNHDLTPHKLLKARFKKIDFSTIIFYFKPELEQVFSGFPTWVEFQHFKTCYYTPFTNILVKKLFGNDLVGRFVKYLIKSSYYKSNAESQSHETVWWLWIVIFGAPASLFVANCASLTPAFYQSVSVVWLGHGDSNGCEDIWYSWSMVSTPHPEYTLDRAHHQQRCPIKNPTTITVWRSPLQTPSLLWSHLQSLSCLAQ